MVMSRVRVRDEAKVGVLKEVPYRGERLEEEGKEKGLDSELA